MFPDRSISKEFLRKILIIWGLLLLSACAANPPINAVDLQTNVPPIEGAQSIPYETLIKESTIPSDRFQRDDPDIHIEIENLALTLADVKGGDELARLKKALQTNEIEYFVTIQPANKNEAASVGFNFEKPEDPDGRDLARVVIATSKNPDPEDTARKILAGILTAHDIVRGATDPNDFDSALAGQQTANYENQVKKEDITNPFSVSRLD